MSFEGVSLAAYNHSMANETVRQHYVPCALLSRFGNGEGRESVVYVWDKFTGRQWESAVRSIAVQNDLYTLPQDAVDAFSPPAWYPEKYQGARGLEAMFADMEGILAQVLDAVERKLGLPPAGTVELEHLVRMLVLLELRNPAHIETNRQTAQLLYNMSALCEANRNGTSSEGLPDFMMPFDENKHILLAQSLLHWDDIVEAHRIRKWSLWYSDSDDVIIGDCPTCRCFARRPKQPLDSPAPAVPNSLYVLPLGSRLLMTGDDGLSCGTRIADTKTVAYCNNLAVDSAERFVYSRGAAFPLLWYEGDKFAYQAITSREAVILRIDAESFASLVKDGVFKKPRRWGVHGGGELQDLVPSENRISTDELMREWERNSS